MVFFFYFKKFFQNLFLSESSRNFIKKISFFKKNLVVILGSEQKFLQTTNLINLGFDQPDGPFHNNYIPPPKIFFPPSLEIMNIISKPIRFSVEDLIFGTWHIPK